MTRKNILLLLVIVLLISIVPIKIMAASDYHSSLRRDVLFTAKDAIDKSSLYDVYYRIYQGESYKVDMGVTTGPTRLEPGKYTITATKDGYFIGTQVITVTEDYGTQRFNFELARDRTYTPSAPTDYTLSLQTSDATTGYNIPDVRYYIEDLDNYRNNQTSYKNSIELPKGNYRISAIKEGYDTESKNIYMPGTKQSLSFSLSKIVQFPVLKNFDIKNVKTYDNRVVGDTAPYAKVSLYKDKSFVESANADSSGYFVIYYDFDKYFREKKGYYGIRIYPEINTSGKVAGYTSSNSPVIVYDMNYSYLGSTVSDYRGYYEVNHPYISNSNRKLVYRDYIDNYNYLEELETYYLVAERDNYSSSRFYLSDGYYDDLDSLYRQFNTSMETATAPVILEALGGTYYVRGEKATPYANITIRDAGGDILGDADLGYDAKFAIKTKRPLISGELLTITTSREGYIDKISSIVVGLTQAPSRSIDSFNYINKFTIGSKELTRIVDTNITMVIMDVAPYITNGRTMLPIRFVAESIGYEVTFDDVSKNAVFVKGDTSIIVNLKSRDFFVNGKKHTFSVDPITVEGRIMLPVSELGKALGLTHGNITEGKNIEWDADNKMVIVQINNY